MRDGEGSSEEVESSHRAESSPRRFLFPVDGEHARDIIPIVCDLVADVNGELVMAFPLTVPEQTPLTLSEPKEEAESQLAKLIQQANQQCEDSPPIDQVVTVGRDRGQILSTLVEEHDIETVITDDHPRSGIRSLLGLEGVDKAALGDSCDTIIVTRINYQEEFDSVLVPIAQGPHSGLAIDAGVALARRNDASLELLHVYPSDDEEAKKRGDAVLERGLDRVGSFEPVETTLRAAEEVPAAIIGATQLYDVVVLGAPREGLIQQFVLGTIPESVNARTDGTMIIAHHGGAETTWHDRWL
jgi:nucleotide-binding universal stress UspA family protein